MVSRRKNEFKTTNNTINNLSWPTDLVKHNDFLMKGGT